METHWAHEERAVFTQNRGQPAKVLPFILQYTHTATQIAANANNCDTLGSRSYKATLSIHYLTVSYSSYVKLP